MRTFMEYIEWTEDSIQEFISNKFTSRGLEASEYNFLSNHLKKLDIDVFVDVGCFLGISTYIIGTSMRNVKYIYAIDNITSEEFCSYGTNPIPKSDYAKFAPEGTIFMTMGYQTDLLPILKKHKNDKVFVFLDAQKTQLGVMNELALCYKGGTDYVGVHDTSLWYKQPRKAVYRSIRFGWFELVDEFNIGDGTTKMKGVTLLRRKK
jgi:hypothetical protein